MLPKTMLGETMLMETLVVETTFVAPLLAETMSHCLCMDLDVKKTRCF